MTPTDWLQLGIALVLVIFAGLTAAAEAALSSFSKARADRLVAEGMPGSTRVRKIVDDPPRYLNTALFLRTMLEISAITLVAKVVFSLGPGDLAGRGDHRRFHDHRLLRLLGRRAANPRPAARPAGRLRLRRTDRRDHHRARARSHDC